MGLNFSKSGIVWALLGLLVLPLGAEIFEANELLGTGGPWVDASKYSYLSYHQTIKGADIDGDGLIDLVVLADSSQFNVPSQNVTRGYDPYNLPSYPLTSPLYPFIGGDLVWFQNDGNGIFFPYQPRWDGPNEVTPKIFNGKTLAVEDLDGDNDQDIVVWCDWDGTVPAKNEGAGVVAWFENRLSDGETFESGRPKFIQHNILQMSAGNIFDGGVEYSVQHPQQGAIADMSWPPDGDKDLIVYARDPGPAGNGTNLYYFENRGPGPASDRFVQTDIHPIVLSAGGYFNEGDGIAVVAEDLNGDSHMDLVLGENGAGGATDRELIYLKRNPGNGRFEKIIVKSDFALSASQSLAVGKVFPGSLCQQIVAGGRLVAGNLQWQSPLSVFSATNVGCSSWNQAILPNTGSFNHIWDVDINDFNNDGRLDVLAFWPNRTGNLSKVLPSGKRSVVPLWTNDGSDPNTWRTFYLGERNDPPKADTANGGGVVVFDLDGDGDLDVIRSHIETNLVYFENTWNTERYFKIEATVVRNGIKQKITTFHSTNPDRSMGPVIGHRVESQ
jgi:hypothetical protein